MDGLVVKEVLGSGRTGLLYLAEDAASGRSAVLRLRLGAEAGEAPGFVEEALAYLPAREGHRHHTGQLPDGTPVEWVVVDRPVGPGGCGSGGRRPQGSTDVTQDWTPLPAVVGAVEPGEGPRLEPPVARPGPPSGALVPAPASMGAAPPPVRTGAGAGLAAPVQRPVPPVRALGAAPGSMGPPVGAAPPPVRTGAGARLAAPVPRPVPPVQRGAGPGLPTARTLAPAPGSRSSPPGGGRLVPAGVPVPGQALAPARVLPPLPPLVREAWPELPGGAGAGSRKGPAPLKTPLLVRGGPRRSREAEASLDAGPRPEDQRGRDAVAGPALATPAARRPSLEPPGKPPQDPAGGRPSTGTGRPPPPSLPLPMAAEASPPPSTRSWRFAAVSQPPRSLLRAPAPRRGVLLGLLVAGGAAGLVLGAGSETRPAACVPDGPWRERVAEALRRAEAEAAGDARLAAALRRRRAVLSSALTATDARTCREVEAALASLRVRAVPHRR